MMQLDNNVWFKEIERDIKGQDKVKAYSIQSKKKVDSKIESAKSYVYIKCEADYDTNAESVWSDRTHTTKWLNTILASLVQTISKSLWSICLLQQVKRKDLRHKRRAE